MKQQHRWMVALTRNGRGVVLAGMLAAGGGVAMAQAAGDAQLQSAVLSALKADAQLKGQQISASVANGVVTLSGNVTDESERTAAEQAVAGVAGVKSIQDSLAVAGEPAGGSGAQAGQANGQVPPPPPPDDEQNGQQQGAPQETVQPGMIPPQPPEDETMQSQGGQQQGAAPQQGYQQGQYPQQQGAPGGYGGGYGAQGPQNGYMPQQAEPLVPGVSPARQNASGPVLVPAGVVVNVRTEGLIVTGKTKPGEFVEFTVANDVYANGVVALPRGATLTGQVVESKNAGAFGGSPKLDIKLTALTLGNNSYPLLSDVWSSQGPNKAGTTVGSTIGGAALGALIGGAAGGGTGAGIGALAGGGAGALTAGATRGPRLELPPETLLQFHLQAPLTVQPVRYDEAERLAASVPQPAPQPVLRPRPRYYYGYPPPPPPVVYVRPY